MQSQRLRLTLTRPLWHNFSACGAAPDDDKSQEGSGTGGAGDGQTNPPKEPETIRDPDGRIRSLTEERDRHFKARQDSERELNELREWKKQADQASLTEAEKAKAQLAEAQKAGETLAETNRRLAIENKFLSDNTVKWHDSAAALKLVDLSAVKVENGVVTNPDALKEAIEAAAKQYPFLVATEDTADQKRKTPPKSGDAPKNPPDKDTVDLSKLQAKYPALRHHVPPAKV